MNKADKKLSAQIDANNYDNSKLLQVKIPLNMPYLTASNFERVDGKIEFNGIEYNYVKSKVCNDTLYLICLSNTEKTKLNTAKSNYCKAVNDIPSNKKDSGSSVKKNSLSYEYIVAGLYNNINSNIISSQKQNTLPILNPLDGFISFLGQPPDASS